MSKFLKAIVNIVLLAAILAAGALLIPPLLGVTTKVSDGTGNTNLSRGSVTYASAAKAADLEKGDRILQEDSSGNYIYTVSEIVSDTSTYTLKDEVSGDTQDQQLTGGVQKVILTLPVIGMLSLTLQSREGIIILGLCVAFLIILFILSEVWRKDEDEDEDEEEDEDEKPLSRKEKRRLKKEQKRKAEEEEEEEEEENEVSGEEPEEEEQEEPEELIASQEEEIAVVSGEEEDAQEIPEVRDLEEEPEDQAVVDTSFLKQAQSPEQAEYRSQEEEDKELERSLAEAVGELMGGEKTESGRQEETSGSEASGRPEEEEIPADVSVTEEEETETESEKVQKTEETVQSDSEERDPSGPVELAIPVCTAEELLKKAEEAGDHPHVIEDKENGITILDYSDIL